MTTQEPQVTETATEEQNTGPHAHIKEVEGENKVLRQRLASTELRSAGLDPNTGLGKAVLKTYNGSFEEGDIVKFAVEEYGYEPPKSMEIAELPPEITDPTQRVEAIEGTSESVEPPTQVPPVQAAESIFGDPEATREQIVGGLGLIVEDIRTRM